MLSIQLLVSQQNPPNIILMIGDGMGLSQVSTGMYANGNKTVLEDFEYVGLSKTHSLNYLVTDSAASATAMASGVKTLNQAVGVDEDYKKTKSSNRFKQPATEGILFLTKWMTGMETK